LLDLVLYRDKEVVSVFVLPFYRAPAMSLE
jgi:hypothetical protein